MNASKESARKAKEIFDRMAYDELAHQTDESLFIQNFLIAAERKLPSESAFAKDKKRKNS